MISEFRVIGPPGTGKTTWLCRQAMLAVEADCKRTGLHSSECRAVLISSLTRAAANELRNRGLDIPAECIGTLHAHAWRALGRPPLCVDAKDLIGWNQVCDLNHRLTGKGGEAPDRSATKREDARGDKLLERYLLCRARCTPRELWPHDVAVFAAQYESWKRLDGKVDFSDVIHDAYEQVETAPGNPSVIFVDEAQDHDRAELRLVRKWAQHCDKLIVVGDPWQNLYEWRGSEPEAFYENEIPPENTRILKQSYRLPRSVHAAAVKLLSRCNSDLPHYEYLPRDSDGECKEVGYAFCSQKNAVDALPVIERVLSEGCSIMVLASCEYLLKPIISQLRCSGIPFWNPFARDRGAFNPLHPGSGRSVSQRIQDYLWPNEAYHPHNARMWTWQEFASWIDLLDCRDFLRRGAKGEIDEKAKKGSPDRQREVTAADIRDLVLPGKIDELSAVKPDFIRGHLAKSKVKSGSYALHILRNYGLAGLVENPKIIVGTIHSVKGAEAHTVFLCPDLSPQGMDALEGIDPDSVYRQFYVGMTRSRERLYLCQPATNFYIDISA